MTKNGDDDSLTVSQHKRHERKHDLWSHNKFKPHPIPDFKSEVRPNAGKLQFTFAIYLPLCSGIHLETCELASHTADQGQSG
jgi:hypothetical protein